MKEYDLISIGTGSAMSIVEVMVQENPALKVAVIDKDEPGGICLTRGCIPSKILLYPAELVRTIEEAKKFGINSNIKNIDFKKVMKRMRNIIDGDTDQIRQSISHSKNIDYYPETAEFIKPYTMKVGNETITANMIFLCTGSKPSIPPIKGIEKVGYLTSDTILKITELPESIAIVGGGYVAAEYGHFLSSMGAQVTVIGRNPQFIPTEEPEISALAKRELEEHVRIYTNHEVREAEVTSKGKKKLVALNRQNGAQISVITEEIMIASGRAPLSDVLNPEKGGIKIDQKGWITVNEYLETSQPNVWALGDANGQYPFKHVANYESAIVYYNAALKRKVPVDYHAVPHAVFTRPEIAAVGLGEKEAIEKFGAGNLLIGFHRYEDTAKGEAMDAKDYFVKVIVERGNMKILGAHIVGPCASVLIHEIIPLMYTVDRSAKPIFDGMHIHPALSEVVERAFRSLLPPEHYHHILGHYGLPS
jgi:mycothione reductase